MDRSSSTPFPPDPSWSFLSVPDLFNLDVADLSGGQDESVAAVFGPGYGAGLTAAPGWDPAGPNGITAALADAWLTQLGMMAQAAGGEPRALLIAGDLIGGTWIDYPERLAAMFGTPGSTPSEQIATAQEVHYRWMRALFEEAGLPLVLAAIGDHDIGDNRWLPGTPRAAEVGTMKRGFGEHMVDPLGLPPLWNGVPTRAPEGGAGEYDEGSYLVQVEGVLFLTLDPFRYEGGEAPLGPPGAVAIDYTPGTLAWIAEVLAAADADPAVDHVVVQAHTPVLGPVNARNSTELSLEGAGGSPFWQLLQAHGTNAGGKVRAYLNGEVHATTAIADSESGIVQISHGALTTRVDHSYFLVVEVSETGLDAREYRIRTGTGAEEEIWFAGWEVTHARDTVLSGPRQVGQIAIDVSSGTAQIDTAGSMAGEIDRIGFRTFVGGAMDNDHRAHDGPSRMWGRAGDDRLDGYLGDDTIAGEAGADTLIGGPGRDALRGGPGPDRLEGGPGRDFALYEASAAGIEVRLYDGTARFGAATGDKLLGIENLLGSALADTLMGSAGDNRILGRAGEDTIRTGRGDDLARGGAGADRLAGEDGADRLFGGTGPDTLVGGPGPDRLLGQRGADRLEGRTGNDALSGGAGADHARGGRGADSLEGGAGADTLLGGAGADRLAGGPGADLLAGGAGADTFVLAGAIGADRIRFDAEEDRLLIARQEGEAGTLSAFRAASRQEGTDVLYDAGADGENTVLLLDTQLAALGADQVQFFG